MRVMAVDYGTRKIGVAVSDALGITARGVATLRKLADREAVERLRDLAEELDPERIVVGLPLRADGTAGDAAKRVLGFVERLRAATTVPVETIGEWLTSFEAEERLRDLGVKPSERRNRVDEVAAVVMLEEYLSTLANSRERIEDA